MAFCWLFIFSLLLLYIQRKIVKTYKGSIYMFTSISVKNENKNTPNQDKKIIQRLVKPTSQSKKQINPLQIIQRVRKDPSSFTHFDEMMLQKTIGNQSVSKLLNKINSNHIQKEESKTGLPNNLKSGIENLSGLSMDTVRVHYNSSKPMQLEALSYTQGTDIYIAPGQEKHLPHEAWHVVQQAQGRVKPNIQMKDAQVNDDMGLEREADTMGNQAIQASLSDSHFRLKDLLYNNETFKTIQCFKKEGKDQEDGFRGAVRFISEGYVSETEPLKGDLTPKPIIIEVMEPEISGAKDKISNLIDKSLSEHIAIVIELTSKYQCQPDKQKPADKNEEKLGILKESTKEGARQLTEFMDNKKVIGGCFSLIWQNDKQGSVEQYPFPFLMARSAIPLHNVYEIIKQKFQEAYGQGVVSRSMDSDVTNDPLLKGTISKKDRTQIDQVVTEGSGVRIVSGGYNWVKKELGADKWLQLSGVKVTGKKLNLSNKIFDECLKIINEVEHLARMFLNAINPNLIYWAEPNTYVSTEDRKTGANLMNAQALLGKPQMKENTRQIQSMKLANKQGKYIPLLATSKPLKIKGKDKYEVNESYLRDLYTIVANFVLEPTKYKYQTKLEEFLKNCYQSNFRNDHSDFIIDNHDIKPEYKDKVKEIINKATSLFQEEAFNRITDLLLRHKASEKGIVILEEPQETEFTKAKELGKLGWMELMHLPHVEENPKLPEGVGALHDVSGDGNNCLIYAIVSSIFKKVINNNEDTEQNKYVRQARDFLKGVGVAEDANMLDLTGQEGELLIAFLRSKNILDGNRGITVYYYQNHEIVSLIIIPGNDPIKLWFSNKHFQAIW